MALLSHTLVALAACLAIFYSPHVQYWMISALLAVVVASLLPVLLSGKPKEAYDLDHAVLNTQKPATMWLNMGYWKDTDSFPEACEALARKLGDLAGIQPGDTILDLGFGCGESLIFWARHYRPSKIIGVTSLSSHHQQAWRAIRAAEDIPLETSYELFTGDAVTWCSDAVRKEGFDRILALDCAYHFRTRKVFLQEAYRLLEFTGTIGLTDLMLPDVPLSVLSSLFLRLICLLTSVPFSNLMTTSTYISQLSSIGYTDIEIEDITPYVFEGLARFIDRREEDILLKTALDSGKLKQYRYFAKVLRWWEEDRLKFVLVKARKGGKTK